MRDFYEKPNGSDIPTLDDLITEYETRITPIVDDLRRFDVGDKVPSEKIAEVASHLSIRAAYIREFVAEGSKSLFDIISSVFESPEELMGNLNVPMHSVPVLIQDAINEKLDNEGLSSLINISKEGVSRLAYFAMREDSDILRDEARQALSEITKSFVPQLNGLARTVHTKTLRDSLAPEQRRRQLAALDWIIESDETTDNVLPDCVLIAKDRDGWGPHILSDKQSTECVVLPLSSKKLAVGRPKNSDIMPIKNYNFQAVSSCFSFFLAPTSNQGREGALTILGKTVRKKIDVLTADASKAAVTDAFKIEKTEKNSQHIKNINSKQIKKQKTGSYTLQFIGLGDSGLAEKVANIINRLIIKFDKNFPFHALDGITFATDYDSALREIDRGFELNLENNSTKQEVSYGVLMPLLVRRNEKIKTHIVVRAEIALSLIETKGAAMQEAESTVLYGLASTVLSDLINRQFPNTLLSPHPETFDGWLCNYTDGIYAVYFANRTSACASNRIFFHQELVKNALDELIEMAFTAYEEYQSILDHEKYFHSCANAASSLIYAFARFYGSKHSFIGPVLQNEALEQCLNKFQLKKWALLLAADLEQFHDKIHQWDDYSEIYFLNRHLERLLFEMGLLPDQLESGQLYIHTSTEARMVLLDQFHRNSLS